MSGYASGGVIGGAGGGASAGSTADATGGVGGDGTAGASGGRNAAGADGASTVGAGVVAGGEGGSGGLVGVSWRLGSARAFIGCELIAAPAALLIGLAGPGPRAGLFAIGGFLVVAGVVGGNVLNATWSQTYTPRELRGRVSTCSGLLNYGAIPLGALCAGTLATALGTHDSIWIMTGLLALCPSLLLLSPLRGRRDFPAAYGGGQRGHERTQRRAADPNPALADA